MSRYIFFIFLLVALLTRTNITYAQKNDIDQSINSLNQLLSPDHYLSLKNGKLIIQYYSKNELIRTDDMLLANLDSTLSYSFEQQAFVIRCLDEKAPCIQRKIHLTKKQNTYSNLYIETPKIHPHYRDIEVALKQLLTD